MSKLRIVGNKFIVIELVVGIYFWCVCGELRNQFFCDGFYWGIDFELLCWILKEDRCVVVCICKYISNVLFCDGVYVCFDD